MRHAFEIASSWILIALLVGIPLYGWVKGVKVYEAFVEGADRDFTRRTTSDGHVRIHRLRRREA